MSRSTMLEQLIEAVREHEVLYNSDMKEYNDIILKMRLWRVIARQCDIPTGEEAKKLWKNLRDGFRLALKTLKRYESEEPPRSLKPWKYTDQMSFLRPFMKDRVYNNSAYYEDEHQFDIKFATILQKDNSNSSLGTGAENSRSRGSTENEEAIECRPDIGLTLLPSPSINIQLEPLDLKPDISDAGLLDVTTKNQRKRRLEETDLDVDPLMEVRDGNLSEPQEDSLKLFFDSMYATAKALPPQLQRVVRMKLFQAVTDAEIAAETMLKPQREETKLRLFGNQSGSSDLLRIATNMFSDGNGVFPLDLQQENIKKSP